MNKLEINEKFLAIIKNLEELKDWRPDLLNVQIDSIIKEVKHIREEVFTGQSIAVVSDVECIKVTIEYLNEIVKQLNNGKGN